MCLNRLIAAVCRRMSGGRKNDEREYIIHAPPETVRQHFLFLTDRLMRTEKDSIILHRILMETEWK